MIEQNIYLQDIRELKTFECEKFDLFQQAPLTDLDKYMNKLRICELRQVFVQTNDDARSSSTQTKRTESKDQSMHFPDDIGFEAEPDNSSSRRFARFLERAAHVSEPAPLLEVVC